MSHLIKRSVGKVSCAAVGHDVSDEDEDELYVKPMKNGVREMNTVCARCGAKIQLKVDPTNEDEYFVTEL